VLTSDSGSSNDRLSETERIDLCSEGIRLSINDKKIAIKMDSIDNVAVIIDDTQKGENVFVGELKIIAKKNIKRGHKIAIMPIIKGKYIIKYGVPIGKAKNDILIGCHVHDHNVSDIINEMDHMEFDD